ncbi:MAG TPA: bi-domain-containing oxidoreductase, partial [Bacteroidales bacterium]|nr:bi-domain-containing oxidoreductase [Bacteroidales bacterium]
MEILEVPFPALGKGQVWVRNHFSVVSAGTESKTVTDARKGYIAKARSRQKEVRQVLDLIRTQGLAEAYRLVMNKLEAPSPLGYSCAGEVIATGEGVTDLKPGDFVACGGQGAYHAGVVAVNRNLCVKVPDGVDLRQAAFATIAAIAFQGIRQADVQPGGNCVVIGLGLIGQLTLQLLDASGVKAIGVDIDPAQVEFVTRHASRVTSFLRTQEGLEQIILDRTAGHGTDAVIITAATASTDPVDLAGTLCRKKGKVVIVGAVPTGFSRENYYKKELDLRMSSSYGPGRYDPVYEEKGTDYPIGYVRWTENRNMMAFTDLLAAGKLRIEDLITHTFSLEDAPQAYEMILEKKEHFVGILIRYNTEVNLRESTSQQVNTSTGSAPLSPPLLREKGPGVEAAVGFIGAGNFAQNMLLPRLKGRCRFVGVATAQGNESLYVGRKYGFAYATGDAEKIFADPDINTVFIVTRHDLHANFVIKALQAGKNVFVEKPLAMTMEELEKIREVYTSPPSPPLHRERGPGGQVMVGFNRRFAPPVREIMRLLPPSVPRAVMIRVNAGILPKEH